MGTVERTEPLDRDAAPRDAAASDPASGATGASSGLRLLVDLGPLVDGVRVGDSVSLSGACLTVTALSGSRAAFDVVPETLGKTYLGDLAPGARLNVERALKAGDRFGGHFVQGHVDGVGRVARRAPEGTQETLEVACDPRLTDLMIEKGSVALDGVSLTLVGVAGGRFTVALIPHTLAVTTLGAKRAGDPVHVECDLIGKWVAKLLPQQR